MLAEAVLIHHVDITRLQTACLASAGLTYSPLAALPYIKSYFLPQLLLLLVAPLMLMHIILAPSRLTLGPSWSPRFYSSPRRIFVLTARCILTSLQHSGSPEDRGNRGAKFTFCLLKRALQSLQHLTLEGNCHLVHNFIILLRAMIRVYMIVSQ